MQIFIIVSLTVVNLILWLIFLIKFKSLFTTDDIIEKTRKEYDQLLTDVNRTALQNIDLIQMKIDELQSIIDVADRRLSTIHNEELFINQKTEFRNETRAKKAYSKKVTKPENAKKQSAIDDSPTLPNIFVSENPIKAKKSFKEQVKELYNDGFSVEQIAHKLNKSTTEVELIVEML